MGLLKLPHYYDVYADELRSLSRGHALYYPEPDKGPIEIADVGFIRKGAFVRLFNAAKDAEEQNKSVPKGFKPLPMADVEFKNHSNDMAADKYKGSSASKIDFEGDLSAEGNLVQTSFSFNRESQRRAMLKLEVPTTRKEVITTIIFEEYARENCLSWYDYAKERGFPVQFGDILLVTEWSRTSAWKSIVCTSKKAGAHLGIKAGFLPISGGAGVSHGYATHGPVHRRAYPDIELKPEELSRLPVDQTVFIVGFRPGKRRLYKNSFSRKIMKHILPFRPRGGSADESVGDDWSSEHSQNDTTDFSSELPDFQAGVAVLAYLMETTDEECVVSHDSEWCDPSKVETRRIVDEFAAFFSDRELPWELEEGPADISSSGSDSSEEREPHQAESEDQKQDFEIEKKNKEISALNLQVSAQQQELSRLQSALSNEMSRRIEAAPKVGSETKADPKPMRPDVTIAVVGLTGTGKSSFVRLATGDERVKVGHTVESETSEVDSFSYSEPSGRRVTFIDTPGYDDSRPGITDSDIQKKILNYLEARFKDGKKLHCIMYFFRIDEVKVAGISSRTLRNFKKLLATESGTPPLKNVVIVTTRWDKIKEEEGIERESKLKTKEEFKSLVDGGARFLRHNNSSPSAAQIMRQLLENDPIELPTQVSGKPAGSAPRNLLKQ